MLAIGSRVARLGERRRLTRQKQAECIAYNVMVSTQLRLVTYYYRRFRERYDLPIHKAVARARAGDRAMLLALVASDWLWLWEPWVKDCLISAGSGGTASGRQFVQRVLDAAKECRCGLLYRPKDTPTYVLVESLRALMPDGKPLGGLTYSKLMEELAKIFLKEFGEPLPQALLDERYFHKFLARYALK